MPLVKVQKKILAVLDCKHHEVMEKTL